MPYGLLADAVVVLHLAFVAFAVGGGFLAWRWPRLLWLHVPALAWAAWIELSGGICPLTPLENALRHHAGEQGYAVGFIEHYLHPLLYPIGLTRETQWLLAAGLLAVNVLAYTVIIHRARRRRIRGDRSCP